MSLSDDKHADIVDAFNTTSRYLDDILNINNVYFESMVSQISNDIVFTKIYDKRDDFDFKIVNFPFLDGDVPHSASYGVYNFKLIRFARVSSHVADFNTCNKLLT